MGFATATATTVTTFWQHLLQPSTQVHHLPSGFSCVRRGSPRALTADAGAVSGMTDVLVCLSLCRSLCCHGPGLPACRHSALSFVPCLPVRVLIFCLLVRWGIITTMKSVVLLALVTLRVNVAFIRYLRSNSPPMMMKRLSPSLAPSESACCIWRRRVRTRVRIRTYHGTVRYVPWCSGSTCVQT